MTNLLLQLKENFMAVISQLTLETTEAQRVIKRLGNHWKHKFEVVEQDGKTLIPFSDTDNVLLSFNETHLFAKLTTLDSDATTKLQQVVLNHINRMANQEFDGTWLDAPSE